jgi:hypothetical protein
MEGERGEERGGVKGMEGERGKERGGVETMERNRTRTVNQNAWLCVRSRWCIVFCVECIFPF